MRRAPILALVFLLSAAPLCADTIVLKNGRRISATNVQEDGDRVFYETSAGRLSFPKSMVARIERGGYADFGSDRSAEPPVTAPRLELGDGYAEIAQNVTAGGVVNREYLTRLEEESSSHRPEAVLRVAMGYHAAALFLVRHGDTDQAIEVYRRGLIFAPENLVLLVSVAQLYLERTEYSPALDFLERARRVAPDSADVAKLTGWAYYGQNKLDLAVKEWKRAYSLRKDPDVAAALEKAERDANEESAYREGGSTHFVLRYNGEAAPELAREVLRVLEDHFRDLESELYFTPPEPIGVVLYTNQAYFDITNTPAWTGAVNDGRIRVPVQGLTSVTPRLSRVLRHELVHSFLRQKTRERCPTWLHEGLAQWFEGKRGSPDAAQLLVANAAGGSMPSLVAMERPWIDLPPPVVSSFYASSLLVVEYMVQKYGMGDIERLLNRMASEPSTEAALKDVLRIDYADLEAETLDYARSTYLR